MTARHDEAWYQRREAKAREWLALADKIHTPQELADARDALDVAPRVRQARLPLDDGRGVA